MWQFVRAALGTQHRWLPEFHFEHKVSVISFNKNEKYWEMSKQFWRLESIKKYQEIILNLQVFKSMSNPNYKWLVGCSIFSTWNWPNFLGWLWVFFTFGKYSSLFLQIFILLHYLSSPLLGLPFQYVRLLDIIWQITEALLFFSIKKKNLCLSLEIYIYLSSISRILFFWKSLF